MNRSILTSLKEHENERLLAIRIANLRLENPRDDPDSDFSTVCRQFLRANENLERRDIAPHTGIVDGQWAELGEE